MKRTLLPIIAAALALTVISCGSEPLEPKTAVGTETHVRDAQMFTDLYSGSRLSAWNVRATAAGVDCAVLFVTTTMLLEDSLIDALHYGSGAYDIYEGGIHEFYQRRAFRGVAYQDRSKRIWTFGRVSQVETTNLTPCQ
jgi:hypothetical protein